MFIQDHKTELIGGILLISGIAAAVFAIKVLPQKLSEKTAIAKGGIRFPSGLDTLNDKTFETVKTTLSSIGYENISGVNLHDIKLGILKKPNTVESIMINGEKAQVGKVYLPDTSIVITYHGK